MKVPFIAELDRGSLEEACHLLVEKGRVHSMSAVNWGDNYSYKPVVSFSLAYGKNDLYVRFFVHGNCLRAVNQTDQSAVEEDSCVGLVLRNPDSDQIFDFAFNCIGTCLATQKKAAEKQLLDSSLLSGIRRFTDLQPRAFCEMEGLFHWQVVVALPFCLLGISGEMLPCTLSGNFYKRADATALPHYLSWIPVKTSSPDFAHAEFLGDLVLE